MKKKIKQIKQKFKKWYESEKSFEFLATFSIVFGIAIMILAATVLYLVVEQ